MTTTSHFQVKPDYFSSEKECIESEKNLINTNSRYKYFCQTHFTAGDIDQFEQYKDSTNGTFEIPTYKQNDFLITKELSWEKYKDLDVESVYNTFNYIFYKFKKGIFIKIKNGKLRVFLPFSNKNYVNEWSDRIKIDPKFENMTNFMKHITTLEGYKFFPNKINKFVDTWYSNNCLLRCEYPIYEGDTNVSNTSDLFKTLCLERKIPDMEFFVNRRDFPILKTNGTEPYSHIYDTSNMKLLSHNYPKYCPILSMVTANNFADIPIPTGDDWARVCASEGKFFPHNNVKDSSVELTPWEDRKPIAIFRGSSTGPGVTIESNPRLKLSYLSKTSQNDTDGLPFLNAGITKWNLRPRKIKGQQYLKTIDIQNLPFGLVNYMTPKEQYTYKYVINIDGHVASYRLSRELESGSCILMVASKYNLWYRKMLKPFVHYVPVKSDLSDLIQKIKWCKENDDECKKISINATGFAKLYLTKNGILDYLQKILIEIKKVNGMYIYNLISPKQVQLQKQIKILQKLIDINNFNKTSKKIKEIFTNTNTSITEYLFEEKYIIKKKSISTAYEAFVSIQTNGLPNFIYNYGFYDDFILLESVKGQTLTHYIKSEYFNMEEFVTILLQLSLALHIAQTKFNFVHNDLTPWNIMIKKYTNPITVKYKIDKTEYHVTTNTVPIIIDLGRSHVTYDSQHYGNTNMFSSSTIQDIVILLVTSILELSNFEVDKQDLKIIVILANFLSSTTYCPTTFLDTQENCLQKIRTFFSKASKYTELINSDKGELEYKNPIDFVTYVTNTISPKKIKIYGSPEQCKIIKPFNSFINESIFSCPEKILSILEKKEDLSKIDIETICSISKTIYSQNLKLLLSSTEENKKNINKYIHIYQTILEKIEI